jgi:tetratricopeptide (TPR) repeat protein
MVLIRWKSVFGVEKGYERAIEDYTAALRLKPDYAFALNNRGVAWHKPRTSFIKPGFRSS